VLSTEENGMRGENGDAELVEAARRGDKEAFASLVERHRSLLLVLCRRMLDALLGGRRLAEPIAPRP
jgi:hypothetical protein